MKIVSHILDLLMIVAVLPHALYLRFIKYRQKEIWLVGERKDQACDNGYHFFKFSREHHSNNPVFYVIERSSRDLVKVSKYGNILYYGELWHYAHWLAARRLICAHLGSCVPDKPLCWLVDQFLRDRCHRIRAFVQHGITKELIPSLFADNSSIDLFVCGATPEAEFINSEFGYPNGIVRYLGFPRFDALHDFVVKKQILLMPTWRKWLTVNSTWGQIDDTGLKQFLESSYFKNYHDLLNDPILCGLLKETGYKLIFYPHHEMHLVTHLFTSTTSQMVIADHNDFDVQQLMKDSAFLVTDYSSIAFDFAYMRKPLLYFQFDCEEYNLGHYAKGYFEYGRDGFGPVLNTLVDVIAELKQFLTVGSSNGGGAYLERQQKFFSLYDHKNCERVYQAIQNL